MLRVHFTADDLARVRVVGEAQFSWEPLLSLRLLARTDGGPAVSRWRAQVRTHLRDPGFARAVRLLSDAASHTPPTMLDPPAGGRCSPSTPLHDAAREYRAVALVPFEREIRSQVAGDRAVRLAAMLTGGVDALLDGFRPLLHWRPPVLASRECGRRRPA